MKSKQKQMKQEGGITLIALIITIIVLVILAAVTLNSIFGSNIVGIATNGAINYAEEQQKELGMLNDVSDLLGDITGDTDRPMSPSITLSGTKGNNDIYTSNVTVTISINKGLEQTGTIKLHYKINDGEEQITEEDVSFEVSEEGITTIIAWTENEKGNLSDNYETSFTINKTAPSNPTIYLSGDIGDNNYYTTDVGVTINAGDASNISSIKYKVEEANAIQETEVQGTTATFDITADGTSTVTAYIINNAGLTSEEITQVVNKDTTDPSTASIALSGEPGETSISVTANGADATSGVASYIFQYSTTSETEEFTTALEVQNTANSCTFEYQDLASDTTYYLRVIVKDRAGNTTTSTVISVKTKTTELNFGEMTEEEIKEEIGKYVSYIPTSGTFSDHIGTTYSGSSSNSRISTETNLDWRILFVEDNTLTLISDTVSNIGFYLMDANGYNNGVLLLNNACKALYSNNNLGAVGRSIKIEDIESVSTYKETNTEYDYGSWNEYTSSERYYPNIFAQEKNGAPNGVWGTVLERSEQTSYITGKSHASSSLNGKTNSPLVAPNIMDAAYMNSTYIEIFTYKQLPEDDDPTDRYWLASRGVCFYYSTANFFMEGVEENDLSSKTMLGSDGRPADDMGYDIRPVVEIDLTKVNIGLTGNGSSSSPYSITAK